MHRFSPRLLAPAVLLAALAACKPSPSVSPPVDAATPTAGASSLPQILAASDLPPTHEQPLEGDMMGVTVHRLSNGLTVYISTDRQKPRFNAWIAVRTGSRNDPADSTGLAHYLEHMLFKGTDELGTLDFAAEKPLADQSAALYKQLRATSDPEARKRIFAELDALNQQISKHSVPNEMSRLYSSINVEGLNAFTSFDQTVYIADVPANRIDAWATVEGERFRDPVFRHFYSELEAVYEEKNLSLDSPDRRVFEQLFKGLFPSHPYGTQTTIGEIEHLKSPTFQDAVDYFNRWYVPNNMAVILAGDIDAKTALPVLERSFGALEPRALEQPAAGTLAPLTGRVASEVVGEGEQSVALAWQTVPYGHPDEPVMAVLDYLMDNSTSGLLNVELELSQKVPDAGSSNSHLHEAGAYTMRAKAREGQALEEVEALLLGVLEQLKAGAFTQQDIDAVVLSQDINDKRRLEQPGFRVGKIASSFINHKSWASVLERDRRLRKVTREEVMRAAKQYLGAGYSVVFRRSGKPTVAKIDKPTITPLDVGTEKKSKFAAQIEAIEATQLEPEWLVEGKHYTRAKLPAGELISIHNPRNDLFEVRYVFERGHKQERLLCHAFALVEQSGAGDLGPAALQKQLFALGTSISFECGDEETTISVDGIDRNMDQSLALLDRWLRTATLDADTLAKLTQNTLSERKDAIEDPDALADALSQYAAHDRASAYLHQPTNKQLTGARVDALGKLAREFLDHEHKTFYFGPRAAADAAKAVPLGKDHRALKARPALTYRKTRGTTIYFVHRDVAKSTVSVAMPIGVGTREQRPAGRFLGQYLGGGMEALLFQEMREARGLAYFVYGYIGTGQRPTDAWSLDGGLGTQNDKAADAIATYLELTRTRPLDERRIGDARVALDQEYRASRIDPRWAQYWVESWDEAGEASDPRPWYWQTIGAMKPEALKSLAGTIAAAPVILSIVGDRNRVDMAALKKLGTVVEVAPGALFSYGAFAVSAAPAAK